MQRRLALVLGALGLVLVLAAAAPPRSRPERSDEVALVAAAGKDAGLDGGIDAPADVDSGRQGPAPPLDDAGCNATGAGGAAGGAALAAFLLLAGLGFRRRPE